MLGSELENKYMTSSRRIQFMTWIKMMKSQAKHAAAAKSLQSCPTLCDPPHRWQPTRLPCPWDSPGKNTRVDCHFLLQCMKVKNESEVAQSCPTLVIPWTAAHKAPPTMGFSRQECWNGVPLPSPSQTWVGDKIMNIW